MILIKSLNDDYLFLINETREREIKSLKYLSETLSPRVKLLLFARFKDFKASMVLKFPMTKAACFQAVLHNENYRCTRIPNS